MGVADNGLSKGQTLAAGAKGAEPNLGHGPRAALRRIRKLAEAASLASDQIPGAIKMAQTVAEDLNASNRDRLAALKLLASLAKLGLDADVQEDHMVRLDSGDSTLNVNHVNGDPRRW
jgi:hypothetical protein